MKLRSLGIGLAVAAVVILVLLSRNLLPPPALAQSPTFRLFLPGIYQTFPLQTVFGVGMDSVSDGGGLNAVAQVPVYWMRGVVVPWSLVETSPGARSWSALQTRDPRLRNVSVPSADPRGWSALASVEEQLRNAASKNLTPIVIVNSTPTWAQQIAGKYCGPIKQESLAAFGTFMRDLVARYSVPPYNVKYWEIWNEPDIAPSLVPDDSLFGCWGNSSDAYYGGGYYASALKIIYPQIKAADPQAQVLVGGLLLDCNPNNPLASCAPSKFLEGILRGGGGPYFDGVSFHAYDYYAGSLGAYTNSNWQSAWNTTGPVGIAKASFLQSVLSSQGVSGKFLMNTEAALLCDSCSSDSTFESTKAYYLVESYASAIAQGLRGNLWYSVMGWRNSGLLNADLGVRPAFTALQFARNELRNSSFTANLSSSDVNSSGIKGYKFSRSDRRIWVLWSLDGNSHTVSPNLGTPLAAWDALGNAVTPASSMSVTLQPLYMEWAP